MKPGDWGGRRAQKAREFIAATLPAPCIRCRQTVWPWQDWDTGHRQDRDTHPELTWVPSNWGPEHRRCNRGAGARYATAKRLGRVARSRTWTAPGW